MRRLLLLLALPAHAEVRFLEPPHPDGHLYLWPLNLHLGYGYIADADRGAHAFVLGADFATFRFRALAE